MPEKEILELLIEAAKRINGALPWLEEAGTCDTTAWVETLQKLNAAVNKLEQK